MAPLSDHERSVLQQLEQQLHTEDPKLADSFARPEPRGSISARRVVFGVVGAVLGLAVVVAGIWLKQPVLGVAGFVVMTLGIVWAMLPDRSAPASGRSSAGPRASKGGNGAFMSRLEERWDKRRDG